MKNAANKHRVFELGGCLLVLLASACGSDSGQSPAVAVRSAGSTDVGEFRAMLAAGRVPSSSLLDAQGYFAEHSFQAPTRPCEQPLCLEPALVEGRSADGTPVALAYLALTTNSTATTTELPRRVVLITDQQRYPLIDVPSLKRGLAATDELLVYLGGAGQSEGIAIPASTGALWPDLSYVLRHSPIADRSTHFIVVRPAEVQVPDDEELLRELGASFAAAGAALSYVSLTVPGESQVGPRALTEAGGGLLGVVKDANELRAKVHDFAALTMVSVASRVKLKIEAGPDYEANVAYGGRLVRVAPNSLTLDYGAVFRANTGAMTMGGKAGSGAGAFFDLKRVRMSNQGTVYKATLDYTDAVGTARQVTHTATSAWNDLRVAFSADAAQADALRKPLRAFNYYSATLQTLLRYERGRCGDALTFAREFAATETESALRDPDLAADAQLLESLTNVMTQSCTPSPVEAYVRYSETGCGFTLPFCSGGCF